MIEEVQLYKPKKRKLYKTPVERQKEARKKKLAKVRDMWALYGLQKPQNPRYSGLGGILWYLLSNYVRQAEFAQYGVCVDGCGIPITDWRDCDCGHLKSSTKLATRFRRENLGLQRKWCNSPYGGAGNSVGFAKTVDERYGAGTALELEKASQKAQPPFSKEWYHQQITTYQQALEELPSNPPQV